MTSTLFRRGFRTELVVSSGGSFGAVTFASKTDTTSELILRVAEPLERALNKDWIARSCAETDGVDAECGCGFCVECGDGRKSTDNAG
eukprot:EC849306.1.p2 GENE.EC849306.1~~EC849306.1.p2  ORF type:complete len:88 (+),score=13.30 EC849306.1:127-390(+)